MGGSRRQPVREIDFAPRPEARAARLDTGGSRALIFSGATRNSLVVLPLALALPAGYAITAAIVVTQTLVKLIGMLVYIRLVPRLVPTVPTALIRDRRPG